ncbi:MAG: hypothetical protein HYR85_25685 [Planctomycetes bacterium]|nr:hypothetical protein [Planctomycetota bacterium]MBI3847727.1 hypothetical protein [Planctomycetota bacterium]
MSVPAIFVLFLASLASGLVLALPIVGLRETGDRFLRFGAAVPATLLALTALLRVSARPPSFDSIAGTVLAAAAAVVLAVVAVLAHRGRLRPALILLPIAVVLVLATLVDMSLAIRATSRISLLLVLAEVVTSSLLLGAVTLSMILGHFYLVAPGLSIGPLRRESALFGASVAIRGAFALTMGILAFRAPDGSDRLMGSLIFLLTRGLFGIVAPAVFAYMVWETVKIRSTQSATGILYVATALVLFGELSAGYLLLTEQLVL